MHGWSIWKLSSEWKSFFKTDTRFWINLIIMKVPNSENLNTKLHKMRKMGHFCHWLILDSLNKIELRIKSSQLLSTPCLLGSIQMVGLKQFGRMDMNWFWSWVSDTALDLRSHFCSCKSDLLRSSSVVISEKLSRFLWSESMSPSSSGHP